MSEAARIVDELARDHSGEPWHGSSVSEILRGITSAQAATRPIAGGHTIWEIVLHMTSWKQEVRRRLNAPPASPEAGDWPPVGSQTAEAWDAAVAALGAAHDALMKDAALLSDEKLFAPGVDPRDRETGAGVSYYVLLHGLAQHDAYHAGQIALLKKAVAETR
jgi:hypothetical protein